MLRQSRSDGPLSSPQTIIIKLHQPFAKSEIRYVKSRLFQQLRNLRVSSGCGNVNCRFALLVSEISVGPSLQ
jgi:hypothetical protein